MDTLTDFLLELIRRQDNPIGLAIIALSALIEYIVPPFPGDTVTLFAAVLITAYGWNFAAVFLAVMAGSVAGSMSIFYLGVRLHRRRRERGTSPRSAVIDRLIAGFRRHGAAYLMLNRFLPGVRTLFFVAAGMASMRPLPVLIYSTLSAALWNLGLIAAGSLLGANFDTLLMWMKHYTTVVWLVLGAVFVVLVVRFVLRRRQSR